MTTADAVAFARSHGRGDAPDAAREHLRTRVLDTLAVTTAGYRFPAGRLVRDYAADRLDGEAATVLDGSASRLSLEGAILANATAANVLDADDGHREVKGHPAAIVVPAALAAAEREDATVGEFLSAVLVGYELAVRAGLAIHAVEDRYTGTGSWGTIGAAAAVARLRDLDREAFAHALGTANYHAPRTPIMRGVERPGMTKDGIGWGAYAGTVSVLLAERGFTASGTVFDEQAVDITETLGERYHVTEGYLKPYPCCRWAHPGIEAVLDLAPDDGFDPATVERVRVETFEAATHIGTCAPDSVAAAEYSYPYPVAAALTHGEFTPEQLRPRTREDEQVRALADRVELHRAPDLDERFPSECLARVTVETVEETYRSGTTVSRGAREHPLSVTAVHEKARALLEPLAVDPATIAATLTDPSATTTDLLAPWHA